MSDRSEQLRVSVDGIEIVWSQRHRGDYAAHWGDDAARWLPLAAQHAERLCRGWRLVPVAPAGDGVQSLVLHAVTGGGEAVVLKVPRSPAVGARERTALEHWAPGPVPRVEAFDPATGALLLQQLERTGHGYTSHDLVSLARHLHVSPPSGTQPVEATCRLLLRAARGYHRGRPTERQHQTDLRLAEQLMASLAGTGQMALLHGDLLHKNLLTTPDGLCAIDPQPVVGPPELDLARWVAWGGADHLTDFEGLVGELVAESAAVAAGWLDEERLVQWTWAVSVCENKPGRAGERPRVAFLDEHRGDARISG